MNIKLTIQIIMVRTLSRTILVVAEISLVTLIPAKLKKAMEIIVPKQTIFICSVLEDRKNRQIFFRNVNVFVDHLTHPVSQKKEII